MTGGVKFSFRTTSCPWAVRTAPAAAETIGDIPVELQTSVLAETLLYRKEAPREQAYDAAWVRSQSQGLYSDTLPGPRTHETNVPRTASNLIPGISKELIT